MKYSFRLSVCSMPAVLALAVMLAWPATTRAASAPMPCIAPPATTTISPAPGTDNDPFPTFSWNVVPQANWYRLWINKDGATFKTMWLFGQTTWTPDTPLADGSYAWWVQTWSPCGAGPWADGGIYVIDCSSPSAPSLNSPPNGAFISYESNFNLYWTGSDDANWAQLWVRRNGQEFFNQWVQYPFGYGSKDYTFGYGVLSNGSYEWQVREWSPCGGTGDWSDTHTFTNDIPACTEVPSPVSSVDVNLYFYPLGGDPTNSTSSVRPQVCWGGTGAPWYRLDVYRNGSLYLTDWADRTTCWYANEDLPAGDYDFYVRAWNECGYSTSASTSTSLVCRAASDISNLTTLPCGFGYGYGSGDGIAFGWDALPGVSWYQVYVSKDGAAVYNEWRDLNSEGASPLGVMSSTGTIIGSPPVPCAAGDYEVWVRGWSRPCGYTTWAGTDMLIECSLDAPVLVGPSGDLFTPRPELEWQAVNGAERYTVQLTRDGSPYHTETIASSATCGTEAIEPNSFAAVGVAQGWNCDDCSYELPLPFSFPLCGTSYSTCYVDTNGRITFDFQDSSTGGDEGDLANGTMIAAMWDDLLTDTYAGDDIYISTNATSVTIRWQGVYYGNVSEEVNFSVTLHDDGTIRMSYGFGNSSSDNLIGISAGDGVNYIVSSQSGTSRGSASDIVFTPGNPTWTPFWNLPLGDYQWWIQPVSECAGNGPLSPSGSFSITPPDPR